MVNLEFLTLREAGVILIDCVHKTPLEAPSGMKYIAIPQMKDGRIFTKDARVISKEDFVEWTKKAKPLFNDVILSRRCNPGESAYVPSGVDWALGQNLVLIRSNGKKIYPPYLRWLLRSPNWWEQVNKFINVGAIFDSLKCADIPNFVLPIPTLEYQEKAASLLNAIDGKIELNNQINVTLDEIAKAIFKEWFIDFGPVKAKFEDRIPLNLEPKTAALFPNTYIESELGLIPEGWRIGTIADISKHNICVLKKSDPMNVIEYVEISGVGNGVVNQVSVFQRGQEPSRAKRKIAHGDTVLSTVRPDRAAYFLALKPSSNLIVSTGFAVFTPKDENWSFLHSILTRKSFFEELGRLADGGAYPAISAETISQQPIVIPPQSLIDAYHKIASVLYELKFSQLEENNVLAKKRDLILPEITSGNINLQ